MHDAVSTTIPGIITTKLTPPRVNDAVIPRKELLTNLSVDAAHSVVLICAPAGYGKTTLARLYVENLASPCAWLSLDPTDNTPAVFLTYLIAAIESACPGACVRSRAGLASAHELSDTLLADRLIRDLADLSGRLVLVLDDYHFIQDLTIHDFLSQLIRRMSAALQIVLVTRMDPPLPLGRLRGHGELAEIRTKQLRFSQAESEAYLQRFGPLPSTALANLVQKSEGWPVGLNLLGLSASMYPNARLLSAEQQIDGSSLVAGYFLEEVLEMIPVREQLLLCSTALPDRFSPSICHILARALNLDIDVQTWLRRLLEMHLFVQALDPYGSWYNYHQLFREFLLVRLRRTQSVETIRHLNLCLSNWFYERQHVEEALRYALAAGDARRAAEIVERESCAVMAATDWRRLGGWLEQLPESVQERAGIQVCYAYQMHFRHRLVLAAHHLDQAEAALSRQADAYSAAQRGEIEGSVVAMRAQHIAPDKPLEAQELAKRALDVLPEKCHFQRSNAEIASYFGRFLSEPVQTVVADIRSTLDELRNLPPSLRAVRLQLMVCAGFYQEADLTNLEYASQELLKLSEQAGLSFARGWSEYATGWLCYQRNDLSAAERYFLAIWENQDLYHGRVVVDALTGLVLIYRTLGEERRGAEAYDWLEHYVRRHNLAQGITVANALRWMADTGHVFVPPPQEFVVNLHGQFNAQLWIFPVTVAIRSYIALGGEQNLATAAELLDECRTNIYAQRDMRIVVELLCCRALLHQAQGREDAAVEYLEEAVRLAAGRGAYRLIADVGDALTPLLQELLARRIVPEFVAQVLSRPGPQVMRSASPRDRLDRIELSSREMEVLLLLAERLSDKEIAAQLKLSTRTVQKHAANIYQKLHVHGRRQAVASARAAGLIT